jgi:hypothetical protein
MFGMGVRGFPVRAPRAIGPLVLGLLLVGAMIGLAALVAGWDVAARGVVIEAAPFRWESAPGNLG